MDGDVVQVQLPNAQPLQVGNKTFKSAYDWELTEKDLEKAARELGETEEKKKKCLEELKEKLSNDPNVKYRVDDFYLQRFLRVRKYDVKKAYQNVKMFFEMREKHPLFFTLSEEMEPVQKINFFDILPYADEEGSILFLMNFNRWDPEEMSFEEACQSATTTMDLGTMNPHCQINGMIGVYDATGMSMRYITELLLNDRLWTYVSMVQDTYPWRIKKIIVVNCNAPTRFLFNIVKPFLKRKIAQRIVLLGSDMNELHQHVNPVLLPKRLQGYVAEEEYDSTQHVLDNLSYLRYERSFS